jgi:hypothetical protein
MTLPPDDDAQPDAAWYERMRLRSQARAAGVSLPVMTAAAAASAAVQAPPPVPDAMPVWQKVGRSLGALAGRITEKLERQRGRVFNPKILVANIKPPKEKVPPPPNWARDAIEQFSRERVVGEDVSLPYFKAVVLEIEKFASDGEGAVHRSHRTIGKHAGLGRMGMEGNWGRETVRKVLDWLRAKCWFGPLNSIYRAPETGEKLRDSNVYILFPKEDASEIMALEPEARAAKRESLTLSRGAALWGLQVGVGGLNAITRTHPRPA